MCYAVVGRLRIGSQFVAIDRRQRQARELLFNNRRCFTYHRQGAVFLSRRLFAFFCFASSVDSCVHVLVVSRLGSFVRFVRSARCDLASLFAALKHNDFFRSLEVLVRRVVSFSFGRRLKKKKKTRLRFACSRFVARSYETSICAIDRSNWPSMRKIGTLIIVWLLRILLRCCNYSRAKTIQNSAPELASSTKQSKQNALVALCDVFATNHHITKVVRFV
jgi:hypothetical protein